MGRGHFTPKGNGIPLGTHPTDGLSRGSRESRWSARFGAQVLVNKYLSGSWD